MTLRLTQENNLLLVASLSIRLLKLQLMVTLRRLIYRSLVLSLRTQLYKWIDIIYTYSGLSIEKISGINIRSTDLTSNIQLYTGKKLDIQVKWYLNFIGNIFNLWVLSSSICNTTVPLYPGWNTGQKLFNVEETNAIQIQCIFTSEERWNTVV